MMLSRCVLFINQFKIQVRDLDSWSISCSTSATGVVKIRVSRIIFDYYIL